MKRVIVTTSWDDGAQEDLKILALLKKYNLKGTFYIPQKIDHFVYDKPLVRLNDKQIKKISHEQEVGAHTLTHQYFNVLDELEIEKEIFESKKWLEELIGQKVAVFAYPGGVFNSVALEKVAQAGFLGGRTVECFKTMVEDNFRMGVTMLAYPMFPRSRDWSLFFRLKKYLERLSERKNSLREMEIASSPFASWSDLSMKLFDFVSEKGGVFHLAGHSWELEKYNLWPQLERVLAYISGRNTEVDYLTNGEVLKRL